MKKKRLGLIVRLAAVVVLVLAMALPAAAMSELESLFYEDLHQDEHLYREVEVDYADSVRRGHLNDDGVRYVYEDLTHVTRIAYHSTVVDSDVAIIDTVKVVIPENKTLTVAKGATLVVKGQLVVKGKLDNRGTIVIGDRFAYKETDRIGEISVIINEGGGEIVNKGTIVIARGELHNEGKASLENSGTINITNKHSSLTGIINSTITAQTNTFGGYILNTGTIHVDNQGGSGIRIAKQSTLENNGTIYITESGTVNGSIKGTRAQTAPKD